MPSEQAQKDSDILKSATEDKDDPFPHNSNPENILSGQFSGARPVGSAGNGRDKGGSGNSGGSSGGHSGGLQGLLRNIFRRRDEEALREAIAEYIDTSAGNNDYASAESEPALEHEKLLISNILQLRDLTALDVMVPRADIVAIDANISERDLKLFLSETPHSRFPVYESNLDTVIGAVHIKDILGHLIQGKTIDLRQIVRKLPIISPAIPVLDLLLQMRVSKRHMALVIDEYGGTDGLVTINDIIEDIVGNLDDEYDRTETPQIHKRDDGFYFADARTSLSDFELKFGPIFSEEEHEDNDTLGGLVSSITGRVPARGEMIRHDSGLEFEILEADPRRIHCLRLRKIPPKS